MNNAYISEIYSAIQGEGFLVGKRQIFLRFAGCDLRCHWCDTPDSLTKSEDFKIESSPGSRVFNSYPNPITAEKLLDFILSFSPLLHHSISVTGGEPLLQSKFLSSFLPLLKEKLNTKLMLETGGHRVENLAQVIDFFDYISMDYKLSTAGVGDLADLHKRFLQICLESDKHVWVKLIICAETSLEEIINTIKNITSINPSIEIFLQPVTPINGVTSKSEIELLSIYSEALKHSHNIRIIPQVHALMGQK